MDYEQLEDFNEALSAAIQSGLDVSCHAVTDMYKETLARAEAAEKRVAELEVFLDGGGWRSDTPPSPKMVEVLITTLGWHSAHDSVYELCTIPRSDTVLGWRPETEGR